MNVPDEKLTGTTIAFGETARDIMSALGHQIDGWAGDVYFTDGGKRPVGAGDLSSNRWIVTVTVERES